MQISEEFKKGIKERLGYNDEELQVFLDNPRNIEVLSKSLPLVGKTIVVEVTESHGCNSQHRVGDKFYFDGSGNLLTKLSPKKICIFALSELDKGMSVISELTFAGVDPNSARFKRVGCSDVGLKCGGWGHIVMEVRVEDRKKIEGK